MNITKRISDNLDKIEKKSRASTDKYKERLLTQLKCNIDKAKDKKQAVQDNKGIIDRYKSAEPKPLTQMQQAMQEALNV